MTASHVLSRIPNRNRETTPYEDGIGMKPSLSYLRTWGCLAKVNVPISKKRKRGPKTVDCVFPGYAHQSNAYRILVVNFEVPDMHVGTIMESRDAMFFKNIFSMKDMHSNARFSSKIAPGFTTPIESPVESFEQPLEEVLEKDDNEVPTRNKRQRIAKSFGDDFIVYLVDDTPTSIAEAYASPNADDWKETIRSKMDSILSNRTWKLSELLSCRLVVNLWAVSGCSRRSLDLMVLLTSARLGLWPRVIPRRKARISLILIRLLLE